MRKFDQFILEMNRRSFLGLGAKAIAASMAPKSVVGSVLKGAMNLTPTAGSPIVAAVKTALSPQYLNIFIDDKIGLNYVRKLKDALISLYPILSNAPRVGQPGYKPVFTLDNILNGKKFGSDLADDIENTSLGQLLHYGLVEDLYQKKLVTPELEKWLIEYSAVQPYIVFQAKLSNLGLPYNEIEKKAFELEKNYHNIEQIRKNKFSNTEDPEFKKRFIESEKRKEERWEKKYEERQEKESQDLYKNHLGYTRSRMDYAGGSEDVDYAQTFESFFNENYADGKKPGRKGLAKRSGVNCKQSVTKLRKIAKNSTGERRRMAHWCANMKSGKKKK